MVRRAIEVWILLLWLVSLWHGVGLGWESTGVLVLDISRSMQDNDPHNLRGDAEQTFIDLLSSAEGNSLGIVFFGAKARVIKPITPIHRETVRDLKESLPPLDSRAQRTEIGLGVAKGLEIQGGRSGTRYLVVLSDGELDRSGRAADRRTRDDDLALRELRTLYPKLREENIPVFTVALTEASRKALADGAEPQSQEPVQMTAGESLLQEIAESTNGKFYRIIRQRDYVDAFLDIFLRLRPPTFYALPRHASAKFYLNQFDAEALVIGPRDMVLETPTGQRFGLGLPSPAAGPRVRVFPYQHWSLAVISRPSDDVSGYEGTYQVVDQWGNPAPEHKVLVHSAITLAWEHPPKQEYARHEVLYLGVKVHSFGLATAQEQRQLAEFLSGAVLMATVWPPQSPLPTSYQLTPPGDAQPFVFTGAFEETSLAGEYRLEVELLSNQHPALNRKLGMTFTVGSPYFLFAVMRHGQGEVSRVLESSNGAEQSPVYVGDRVELLAELAGGTDVDFRREPAVFAAVEREGRPWQVIPLDRVQDGPTLRYRSKLVTLPSAGTYGVTFRAEGNALTEVWDEHPVSTRNVQVNPVQIVFPGTLTVSPAPWTPGRILGYVTFGGTILGVAIGAGMAVIAQFVRTPLRGWLLSTGQGTPQLFVLSGNPHGESWRRIFPKTRVTVGTGPRSDYVLDTGEVGGEVEAEISVGPWWDRSEAIYVRSTRSPSRVYVDGAEVAGRDGVILMDKETLEKPVHIRFGKYEMTFDA